MLGTVSLSSLTAIVKPYVLFDSIIARKGSLVDVSFYLMLVTSNLLGDITEIFNLWLKSPVPFVLVEKFMLVEKSATC